MLTEHSSSVTHISLHLLLTAQVLCRRATVQYTCGPLALVGPPLPNRPLPAHWGGECGLGWGVHRPASAGHFTYYLASDCCIAITRSALLKSVSSLTSLFYWIFITDYKFPTILTYYLIFLLDSILDYGLLLHYLGLYLLVLLDSILDYGITLYYLLAHYLLVLLISNC